MYAEAAPPSVAERLISSAPSSKTLPSLLIQHPGKSCAYFIPREELLSHKATGDTFARLRHGTVTFSISTDELFDEAPAYNQDPSNEPDVLVRFLFDRSAYFLSFEALQTYRIPQPEYSFGTEYVSFIIPGGMELVQEIPLLKRGLLQSNTG